MLPRREALLRTHGNPICRKACISKIRTEQRSKEGAGSPKAHNHDRPLPIGRGSDELAAELEAVLRGEITRAEEGRQFQSARAKCSGNLRREQPGQLIAFRVCRVLVSFPANN